MEQSTAIYLGTFALIAFLLKSVILLNIEMKSALARTLAVLCLLFVVQNAAEFLGYFTYMGGQQALGELFVHLYMISLYFIFPAVLQLALVLGEAQRLRAWAVINFGLAAALTFAHLGGFVISGFAYLGWSVITTPAALYGAAMIYILLNIVTATAFVIYRAVAHDSFEIRTRARAFLLAVVPLLAVVVIVVSLRAAGFEASSAISLPFATTLFLFMLLLHTNGNLFWLSLRLRTIAELLRMKDLSSIDRIMERLEELRIRQALKAGNGNQRASAQLINLTEPTLSRRIARYNIDVSEYQTRPLKI